MGIFKAYDIRGIYGKEFDEKLAYKIGYFIPQLLSTNKVLVGRDIRESSDILHDYLVKGIIDSGSDVYDLGLATTPYVYFATKEYNFDASIQITASHNSKEYNGFKISSKLSIPVGYETGLDKLERMIENNEIIVSETKGKIIDFNRYKDYIEYQKKQAKDYSKLKIGIDCSSGVVNLFIKELIPNAIFINDKFDGTFKAHEPNPLNKDARNQLINLVKENNLDLGIMFDGDADRVAFIDNNGDFIEPDLMIGLLGEYYLSMNKNEEILCDIRTSKSTTEYIAKLGGKTHLWKVGHAYAKRKMRELDCVVGGELSGHYYFRDFNYCDSGILACLIILNIILDLNKNSISISDKIKQIKKYATTGEVNYTIDKKDECTNEIEDYFNKNYKVNKKYDFDGIRLEFDEFWFNIRKSNTEPYLRLVLEANNDEILHDILNQIEKIMNKYKA